MQNVKMKGHTGADGNLVLKIATGMPESDVEVEVAIHPMAPMSSERSPEDLGWPSGFFERTAGCLADTPIERPPQAALQEREPLE